LLLAPVTVTPTKPLLPTHVKGLLWVDVLHRATQMVCDVSFLWNARLPNLTGQTVYFWDYLDRKIGRQDYAGLSDLEIGELYVQFHAEGVARPYAAIRPYMERVECEGWVHPASRRMLECWTEQLTQVNVVIPGFTDSRPLPMATDELVELLVRRRLALDHRRYGGPVYLDGTRWGMPLRPVISEEGQANYLLMLLRDLFPAAAPGRDVLLVHDDGLTADYVLVDRLLSVLGARVSRLTLGRVPINGTAQSSRRGGWDDVTLRTLIDECRQTFDLDTVRLGLRIYFIAMLNRTAADSFRWELLLRAMRRAERLIETAPDVADLVACLRRHQAPKAWVDPYRLTQSLMRSSTNPDRELLREVYL